MESVSHLLPRGNPRSESARAHSFLKYAGHFVERFGRMLVAIGEDVAEVQQVVRESILSAPASSLQYGEHGLSMALEARIRRSVVAWRTARQIDGLLDDMPDSDPMTADEMDRMAEEIGERAGATW
ncbi:hypothetical protein [Fimbriiglobus ruber]|nr:hypothetical protein [Fimbriiglobus ruber]